MIRGVGLATVLGLFVGTASCVPWTVRPIDSGQQVDTGSAITLAPAAYVDSIWTGKLVPAMMNSAVDARVLLNALAASPADAQTRYGHREPNGPCYFIVKGDGIVTSIDTHSRVGLALVDIAPFDK